MFPKFRSKGERHTAITLHTNNKYTRALPSCFWCALNPSWQQTNHRNNMVSDIMRIFICNLHRSPMQFATTSIRVKSSQVKSKLAGPKQKEFKICRSCIVQRKNAKSRFINIQWSYAAASTIQLSKPFQMEYFAMLFPKCRLVARVSVVVGCSIRESCGSTVQRVKLQRRLQISRIFQDCFYACNRPRFQSSVVRQHLYFVVPSMQNIVPW